MPTRKQPTWNEAVSDYGYFIHDTKILFPALKKLIKSLNGKGKSVIDIACGTGLSSRLFAEAGCRVTGYDISTEMIQRAAESKHSKTTTYFQGDARNLPAKNASADLVSIVTLLSNFSKAVDIQRTFQEASRILRKSGQLIVCIPHPCSEHLSFSWARIRRYKKPYRYFEEGLPYHLTLYREDGESATVTNYHWSIETYLRLLLEAGFTLEQFLEPRPITQMKDELRFPVYLMLVARKK